MRITTRKADAVLIDDDPSLLPAFNVVKSVEQATTNFTGIFDSDFSVYDEVDIDLSWEDLQLYMSWEQAWPSTGRRVEQFIRFQETELSTFNMTEKKTRLAVQHFLPKNAHWNSKNRKKRKIFSSDNRHLIPLRIFGHRFPFTSVVKLSTGCTGTLISPKHVLTSAHCIHDQSDYVAEFNKLKVGLIPDLRLSNKFHWIRVGKSFLPNGWLMGNANIASRFDYALLELNATHKKPFFELAISEGKSRAIIHFTAYEDDKPANTLWYRYVVLTTC